MNFNEWWAKAFGTTTGMNAANLAWEEGRKEQADELDCLREDNRCLRDFAELWYYAMDEAPMAFEKIVTEYTPSSWLTQIAKHRRENKK